MNSKIALPDSNVLAQLYACQLSINELATQGLHTRRVFVDERRSVILIDPPLADSRFQGAMRRRETINHITRTVMATALFGCQIEWQISHGNAPQRGTV